MFRPISKLWPMMSIFDTLLSVGVLYLNFAIHILLAFPCLLLTIL